MKEYFATKPEENIESVSCEKTGSDTWTCKLKRSDKSSRTLNFFDRLQFHNTSKVFYSEAQFKDEVASIGDEIIADYGGLSGACLVKTNDDLRILECWSDL